MYEQIYNLTSMFFKSLKGNLMYESLISKFNGKRGPKRQLSFEQIVALNIYRFHFKNGDLKNYHKMIKELMSDKVPNLPNYENFMKATNKSTVFILAFMNFLLEMNRAILKTSFSVMQILLTVNMNRLMSRFECYHIKHRSIIESDWGTLKNNFQLEYHKARSIVGMFRHFFYSIAAYMINRNLDFYQNFFRLRLI